jgi:hypothetical protein
MRPTVPTAIRPMVVVSRRPTCDLVMRSETAMTTLRPVARASPMGFRSKRLNLPVAVGAPRVRSKALLAVPTISRYTTRSRWNFS